MDNGSNFIRTTDFETYQKLLKEGLQEIPSGINGIYMFINPHSFSFSMNEIDEKKISYTNKISV